MGYLGIEDFVLHHEVHKVDEKPFDVGEFQVFE